MEYKISVVIRTYNEEKHIGEVLDSLFKQTYRNYEVVIVDSESTDSTIEIAQKYNVRIVTICKSEFNYSYASNVCVKNATGDVVCFLSGHSIPVKATYLADTNEIFQNDKIGACYGDVIALPDGSLVEKAFNGLGYLKNIIKGKKSGVKLETSIHPGIFSCSNASARKDLLEKHPFAVELGWGGEDVEVAYRIIKDGYYVACVPELLVMHSHGSGVIEFSKEFKNWKKMYNNVLNYIGQEGKSR